MPLETYVIYNNPTAKLPKIKEVWHDQFWSIDIVGFWVAFQKINLLGGVI